MPSKKIIVTGGGTGGHVFPALAIAEEMRRRGYEVIYVGTERGMESKLVPEKGFRLVTVKAGAVKNQGALTLIKTLFRLASGILSSMSFIGREKPAAILGVGGYVSVPMCVAGFLRGVPVFLQEQNVSVGIANRFLGKLSRRVFLGFAQAQSYFPKKKCVVTGNPIRAELKAAGFPAYDANAKRLLIVGGSQGSMAINKVIIEQLPKIDPSWTIVHQTGEKDFENVRAAYQDKFHGKHEVSPFIRDMASAYAGASLVVGRSGALTVSELIQVGRPAVFVPLPRRGQNDQTDNARLVEKHGAARVVEQGERFSERFWSVFQDVSQPSELTKMAQGYSQLRYKDALVTIGDHIQGWIAGQEPESRYVQKDQ